VENITQRRILKFGLFQWIYEGNEFVVDESGVTSKNA
jgi:hypothetical protein